MFFLGVFLKYEKINLVSKDYLRLLFQGSNLAHPVPYDFVITPSYL